MELSIRDSFVVRTSHEIVEVEAWGPERCSAVMARVTRAATQGVPVLTPWGSWGLRGTFPSHEESSCLPHEEEVSRITAGPRSGAALSGEHPK